MTSAFLTLANGQGHTIRSKVTDVEVSAFSECFLFSAFSYFDFFPHMNLCMVYEKWLDKKDILGIHQIWSCNSIDRVWIDNQIRKWKILGSQQLLKVSIIRNILFYVGFSKFIHLMYFHQYVFFFIHYRSTCPRLGLILNICYRQKWAQFHVCFWFELNPQQTEKR